MFDYFETNLLSFPDATAPLNASMDLMSKIVLPVHVSKEKNSIVSIRENAYLLSGCVITMMIVETTRMKRKVLAR